MKTSRTIIEVICPLMRGECAGEKCVAAYTVEIDKNISQLNCKYFNDKRVGKIEEKEVE